MRQLPAIGDDFANRIPAINIPQFCRVVFHGGEVVSARQHGVAEGAAEFGAQRDDAKANDQLRLAVHEHNTQQPPVRIVGCWRHVSLGGDRMDRALLPADGGLVLPPASIESALSEPNTHERDAVEFDQGRLEDAFQKALFFYRGRRVESEDQLATGSQMAVRMSRRRKIVELASGCDSAVIGLSNDDRNDAFACRDS